ncbi:MAG: phosphate signaling complex protein PhoU [Chloroflexota bacterium]
MNHSSPNQALHLAKNEVLTFGCMVEMAILDSVAALKDHDFERSQILIEYDKTINAKRFEIEQTVIGVISARHPAGRDLRILSSILDLSRELERIGDYAKGIAVINLRSGGISLPRLLKDLYHMSLRSADMVHRALTAFNLEDVKLADAIIQEDILIDSLYNQLYFEVLDSVVDDARNIERVNHVLWVGHNLERMADRACNICERVIFIATGKAGEVSIPFASAVHQFDHA